MAKKGYRIEKDSMGEMQYRLMRIGAHKHNGLSKISRSAGIVFHGHLSGHWA